MDRNACITIFLVLVAAYQTMAGDEWRLDRRYEQWTSKYAEIYFKDQIITKTRGNGILSTRPLMFHFKLKSLFMEIIGRIVISIVRAGYDLVRATYDLVRAGYHTHILLAIYI